MGKREDERDAGAVQARPSSRQVEYDSLCQTTELERCSRLFTRRVDHPRRDDGVAPSRSLSVSSRRPYTGEPQRTRETAVPVGSADQHLLPR